MGFIALEVSLNGNKQYIAGIEEWQAIWANVFANRIDPAVLAANPDINGADIPDMPVSVVSFSASVAIPNAESDRITDSDGRTYNSSKTGSYERLTLSPGDTIQIKVIDTDSADTPAWQERDPRFPHGAVVLSKPEAE